jgi:hypothetical protein
VYSERRKGGDTMIRKDLIIAILATFCLTATLFLVIPTRSQTANQYDPWLDTNADGKIDGKDLGTTAYAFGSYGDPTKDVNVTNWRQTYSLQTGTINMTSSGWSGSDLIYCEGYSRLSIMIGGYTNASIGAGNNITIYPWMVLWVSGIGGYNCMAIEYLSSDLNVTIFNGVNCLGPALGSCVIETKAPYFSFNPNRSFKGNLPADWWVTFEYAVYFRNE